MSKLTKIVIGCFAVCILAVVLYQWGFCPLYARIVVTSQQIKAKEAELALIKAKVERLPELKQVLAAAGVDRRELKGEMREKDEIAEICKRLDFLARRSKLNLSRLSAARSFQPYEKDHRLRYLSVQVEGTGYFQQITDFFDSITGGNLLLQVEKYSLTSISKGKKPLLNYQITINAFEISSEI